MLQLKSRFVITGKFKPSSQVVLLNVPAFCHWFEKPSDAAVGTFRISFLVVPLTCVSSTPSRFHSVRSVPSSVSVVVSGLRFGLPAWPSVQPVELHEYVSYCAEKLGGFPAEPRDARRRKSLIALKFQNGSCDTRHTADRRPKGAQRL